MEGMVDRKEFKTLAEALDEIERLNMELAEVKKWLQGQALLLEELRK